jgi:hypothetical protein
MKTWNPPKCSKTMTLSRDCCSRALSEESGKRISMCMPWTSLRVRDSMWKRMLARMPTWHWSACVTYRKTMQALHAACMAIYIDVNGACAPACCDMRPQDLSSGIAFFCSGWDYLFALVPSMEMHVHTCMCLWTYVIDVQHIYTTCYMRIILHVSMFLSRCIDKCMEKHVHTTWNSIF